MLKTLKNVELFKKLSKKEIEKIQKIGRIKKFKKGDIIFNKNEIGRNFFIVKKGEVKIFTEVCGKEKVLALMNENDFFGELALLGIKYRTATAVCGKDCEVYVISQNDFYKFLNKNHSFTMKLLYTIAERLKNADEEIENLLSNNMFGRIVKFLYKKYCECKTCELKITQDEMAKLLGTTRVPVNRTLSLLKKRNIIETNRGVIKLIDIEKIKGIAE